MSYNNFIRKKRQNIFNIYFLGEPLFWLMLYNIKTTTQPNSEGPLFTAK